MIEPSALTFELETSYWVLNAQIKDLGHDDCLRQLPFRGNCMNWTLGHIIEYRNVMLEMLGEERIWGDTEGDLYKNGSEPITDGANALHLDRLKADLETTQHLLLNAIPKLTPNDLEKMHGEGDRAKPLGRQLKFLTWHEAYHAGQTEILRQLTGIDDKVI